MDSFLRGRLNLQDEIPGQDVGSEHFLSNEIDLIRRIHGIVPSPVLFDACLVKSAATGPDFASLARALLSTCDTQTRSAASIISASILSRSAALTRSMNRIPWR